ncbi:MAG: glycosyltransferase [Bacteroidales bacterium]|nr:glycosyltransferase [Bacteroidales bacterium]
MKKIIFLTTSHHYLDDRIFYHQALSLAEKKFEVKIVSLSSDFISNIRGIQIESSNILNSSIKNKVDYIIKILNDYNPHIAICSEPLAVYAASKYSRYKSCKIVYDITEWYPSKKQLNSLNIFKKISTFIVLTFYNILVGAKSSGFIFGEIHKQFPFKQIFPRKPSIILPYYPSQKYISFSKKSIPDDVLKLCYTGRISKEKGIENFFKALNVFRNKYSIPFQIIIIGKCNNNVDLLFFNDLIKKYNFENIVISEPIEFEKFSETISNVDICFDLRDNDFENNHCLPIKLFYYMACGKPVIYTDLKSIRNFVEMEKVGILVNPYNYDEIADNIYKYTIDNANLYTIHSSNARLFFLEKYNWELIKERFVGFINNL